MKKLFTVLFFTAFLCPLLCAEVEYKLPDDNFVKEINKLIEEEMGNHIYLPDPSAEASFFSLLKINFTRNSLVEYKGVRENFVTDVNCLAIALDKSWVLSSGHCFLNESMQKNNLVKLPNIDKIINIQYGNFNIEINNKHIKAVPYKLSNLYLFRLIKEDGTSYELENIPFANLIFLQMRNKIEMTNFFKKGHLLINRTMWAPPVTFAGADFMRHTYYPYNFSHNRHLRKIKEVITDKNTTTVIINGILQHRAGDPLFYIGHGKEYLVGFGYALNIPDNPYQRKMCRTNNVTLLSNKDRNEILSIISALDSAAAKKIAKNILIK